MINDDESLLNKANRELYTDPQSGGKSSRSFLHEKKIDTPDRWKDVPVPGPVVMENSHKNSLFKKIFFGALAFLVLAAGIAAFSFLQGINNISSRNVMITITTRPFVDGGEVFPVEVSIVNRNRVGLEPATLTLEYPEGNAQNPDAVARIEREIGEMGSGEIKNESFDVALFGEEGSTRAIKASLEFRVRGSNVVYISEGSKDLVIRSSPVLLTAEIPESVTPNQEVPLKFTVTGNGTNILSTTALVVTYPEGFTFDRADINPTFDNNIWFLGDLPPGVNRTITVYGTFIGGVNELKTIRASVGIQDPRNERLLSTVYNSVSQVVPLTTTFLSVQSKVGSQSAATVPISATGQASVVLEWANTLPTPITNVELKVKLSGSAYDPARVQSGNGFFNTNTNTITWTRQQISSFSSIAPGQSGQVSFSVTPRASVTGANPSIEISVDAMGFDNAGTRLNAERIDVKKLILNSDLNLISQTLYYSGSLQNTGPMPPQVGKETTYTINWQISNSRNSVSDAKVTTILPLGINWKNVIVPQSEQSNISYNTVTREIVWDVGTVNGGSTSKNISFKVGVTPGNNNVGDIMDLTGDIILTGKDDFTQNEITVNRRALTTQLFNDTSSVGADGRVVQ